MSDPFIGEIRIMGFGWEPRDWAQCNGQLLEVQYNMDLFSLLGTTYGGDGKKSFGLPNLQGRAPMHPGQGPGLSNRALGETGGAESVALNDGNLPAHTHQLYATGAPATRNTPVGNSLARAEAAIYAPDSSPLVSMVGGALATVGTYAPHNNLQPYLTLCYCIALRGIYPKKPE